MALHGISEYVTSDIHKEIMKNRRDYHINLNSNFCKLKIYNSTIR